MTQKIIAVVGATGAQGGGLVRAMEAVKDGPFVPRALTRNPQSANAQAMAAAGVEVMAADIDKVETLAAAFDGAHGVFCVTNFWEHFSPEREQTQARNMAQAAAAAGVKHVVWSTLEDTRRWVPLSDDRMPTLMGQYKVPHFDAKGVADDFFRQAGVPTTFLLTSFYWENFVYFGLGPKRGPDGVLRIGFPMADKKLPGIAVEDIGKCAYGIFERGETLVDKTVGIAGEHLTGDQMAAGLSTALGQEIQYAAITPEAFRAFGFPGAEDLGNMFQFKRDFNDEFCAARDLAFSRSLNPKLQTFAQWLAANGKKIPVE